MEPPSPESSSSSESLKDSLDLHDCNDFGWPKTLEITLDPKGVGEHYGSRKSFWSGHKVKDRGLFRKEQDPSAPEQNAAVSVGNASTELFERYSLKSCAERYQGVVTCGSQETNSHPAFLNSVCCRSGKIEYKYEDQITTIVFPQDMANLATMINEYEEHDYSTTMKIADDANGSDDIRGRMTEQGLPVYLHNSSYWQYPAPVCRFTYEADVTITKIRYISDSADDADNADADVEEISRTTKAVVTIQREVACDLRRSTEAERPFQHDSA